MPEGEGLRPTHAVKVLEALERGVAFGSELGFAVPARQLGNAVRKVREGYRCRDVRKELRRVALLCDAITESSASSTAVRIQGGTPEDLQIAFEAATIQKEKHMNSYRLPDHIEIRILEMAENDEHRHEWRHLLDFGDTHMRDAFMTALRSPDITTYVDVCHDDPNEICVRGRGREADGAYWQGNSIILLSPEWDKRADMSQALADMIVDIWGKLQELARETA